MPLVSNGLLSSLAEYHSKRRNSKDLLLPAAAEGGASKAGAAAVELWQRRTTRPAAWCRRDTRAAERAKESEQAEEAEQASMLMMKRCIKRDLNEAFTQTRRDESKDLLL